MLEHHAKSFYYATRKLYSLQSQIVRAIEERGSDSLPNEREADETRKLIKRIEREAERLQLSRVLERLHEFNDDDELLQPLGNRRFTLAELRFQLEELHKDIQRTLPQNKFLMIPANKTKYYDQTELFGNMVYTNFESTRNDVLEVGNCFATGRNTACVFHCMRVLERGLHALVHELNSKFSTNINFSKGVEHTNWGNIIDKIESEIRELLKPTRQPRLAQSDLQFYSQAAKEFVYFKNTWRDDVSHSRSSYDPNEAKVVMEHVKAFMQHLATKLHE
jgi:hypothetical protein